MAPEHPPVTNPEEVHQLKTSILDQWRRLPPEAGAALVVEQLQDLKEQGLMVSPETDPVLQPFEVVSVCRADMEECFSNEEIARFDDADMKRLADTMGDWYLDESYWHDLETIGRIILEEKDKQHPPNETT